MRKSANGKVVFSLAVIGMLAATGGIGSAQDAVFNKLRQLPDLGACPSSGTADADLKKVLSAAVAEFKKSSLKQAQDQADALVNSIERMKAAGLASGDVLQQMSNSASQIKQDLSDSDDCKVARAFARLTASPTTPAAGPPPPEAAKRFSERQGELMAEEAERNKHRNPNLVVNPIRIVFDPTEIGEKATKDIAVSIQNIDEIEILSTKISRTDNLDAYPEAFSLIQPDLQCPEVATSSTECHLRVEFHPARDGFASAYVNIITRKRGSTSLQDTFFDRAYINGTGYVSNVARLNGTGPLSNHPGLRSVMGFDISGASNAATQQKFFLEFEVNAPLGFAWLGAKKVSCFDNPTLPECKTAELVKLDKLVTCKEYSALSECKGKTETDQVQLHATVSCLEYRTLPECKTSKTVPLERKDPLSRPLWFFLNPRITSVPQSPTSLGSLNIQSISDSITGNNNTTSLVQGLDLQGGLEYFVIRPRQGLPFWSVVKNARARAGLALVGGVGFTTPFSLPDKTTQEFTINSTILAQFPNAANPQKDASGNDVTPTIIAFVNKERSRFFRRYYAGLRLKTYFFSDRIPGECDDSRSDKPCEGLINLFPGVVDITAGKDEAVTGGHLADWVFRLDAVYPLPFIPAFHIFGGANLALSRNKTTLPLILEPPSAFLNLSDPHVYVQALDPPNRDTYRIGLGVDLLEVIKSKMSKPAAAPEIAKESK